jgi:hypothetical protein
MPALIIQTDPTDSINPSYEELFTVIKVQRAVRTGLGKGIAQG